MFYHETFSYSGHQLKGYLVRFFEDCLSALFLTRLFLLPSLLPSLLPLLLHHLFIFIIFFLLLYLIIIRSGSTAWKPFIITSSNQHSHRPYPSHHCPQGLTFPLIKTCNSIETILIIFTLHLAVRLALPMKTASVFIEIKALTSPLQLAQTPNPPSVNTKSSHSTLHHG